MQFKLHPLLSLLFPSSHVSVPSIFPSPQKEQNEAYDEEPAEQIHPESESMQLELHPSLFGVPSSHVSEPSTFPSPQKEQTELGISNLVRQIQSRGQPMQLELHPFLSLFIPSSHVSEPSIFPLPQTATTTGVQISGSVNGSVPQTQSNPFSLSQVEEHPSPESLSPSSHYSPSAYS